MKKFARKVARSTKSACQFKFTATFEYINLTCNEGWEPESLRITWQRGHRRSESSDVSWVPKSDIGEVREGRAVFDPPSVSSLIVTLYELKGGNEYEQKDYKFYLENEGVNGKKLLASFTCNLSEYAGVPNSKSELDMTFKPLTRKISSAVLGVTLESEFMKKGKASDDDMMSTFSRVSGGDGDGEEEEEDDADPSSLNSSLPANTSLEAASNSVVSNGVSTMETSVVNQSSEAEASFSFIAGPDMDGQCWLPDDISLIDSENQPVAKSRLDQTDIVAMYFSAQWCPPCRKFLPKLIKFYNFMKEQNKSFEILYISSDNTKDEMLAYIKEMQMPWIALSFESPLGEQLRSDFKISAIPLLCIVSRNGEVLHESAKKQLDGASSAPADMVRLYNKWIRALLQAKGLPVPEEEPEKKKGFLSGLFGGGKKKDKKQETVTDEASGDAHEPEDSNKPSKNKEKEREELMQQKENLEKQRTLDRKVVEEKTQKLHVTLELNAQMQRELDEKDERIRLLEAKNDSLQQTVDTKSSELEDLKLKVTMLEGELTSKRAEEQKLKDEKRELLANISLHGWLFKKGVKGPTASAWRRRYFRIEEGKKLTYYKTAGEGPPQGFIDLDKVKSVQANDAGQQDKNNSSFNLVIEGRTYELQAHDKDTMEKWISSIRYMQQWREKQKRADAAK